MTLNLTTISLVHGELVAALKGARHVVVAIDPAASVDLTLVQTLEAARRAAQAAGGALDLAEPASGELLATLQRGGFLEGAAEREFWLKSEGAAA